MAPKECIFLLFSWSKIQISFLVVSHDSASWTLVAASHTLLLLSKTSDICWFKAVGYAPCTAFTVRVSSCQTC